jgi:succinate dehydrogenase / fumarate reductase, flavoprotein subunit
VRLDEVEGDHRAVLCFLCTLSIYGHGVQAIVAPRDTAILSTDVLVIGSGAAGMSAAIAADEADASVLLVDRSLIGRGGATVMAQMTVAVALGDEVPDHWQNHLADTIIAGRGLCDERLAAILCENGPDAIRRMDRWHVGWARHGDGRIRQAQAPGHDRPRCVYVDFLATGPAVSRTLRGQVQRQSRIRRVGDLAITDLVVADGVAAGAVGFSVSDGRKVAIAAKTVLLATGGLTRLYRRNSASTNMGGDGYALALRAGARLVDMEFVQFFPIGHLAPRLIGMDPIMWDPFRYKLGGRLLNSEGREFIDLYGVEEDGTYRAPRDIATYAILKEVEAGRGSPAGGVYLSFRHVPGDKLREAFGPVIDRLARNGIDLGQGDVEVAPIAHYHMGGIGVAPSFETGISGLFAAGEAIGGANGANRLSGNAITEALVFGRIAGANAAARAGRVAISAWRDDAAAEPLALVGQEGTSDQNCAALIVHLQEVMARDAGPFRSEAGLRRALGEIARFRKAMGAAPPASRGAFDANRLDWFDLRNMLLVAESVATAALRRTESRGAHQRDDFPATDATWARNQTITLRDGRLAFDAARAPAEAAQ